MDTIDIRIRNVLDRIARSDPELDAELGQIRERNVTRMAAANLAADLGFRDLTSPLALDAVTVRAGRPVLKVFHDELLLDFVDAESEIWRDRLIKARSNLVRAVRAVGRIEVQNNPQGWVGTGFLVAGDVVVTNQHVANTFAKRRQSDSELVFKLNAAKHRMSAAVDFLEEVGNDVDVGRTFQVVDILHLELDETPDVALLQVKAMDGKSLPTPLVLASAPAVKDQWVAAIGYPARSSQAVDQEFVEKLFAGAYDKKRLSPGQITGVGDSVLNHDCLTLSKSSGSPLVSLESGEVVGLHFEGANFTENFAVSAAVVAGQLPLAGRDVRFGPSPGTRERVSLSLAAPPVAVGGGTVATVTIPIQVTVTIGIPLVAAPSVDVKVEEDEEVEETDE